MSKRSNSRRRSQRSRELADAMWRRGAGRLREQGRLLWMLGEGLSAALTAREEGWAPADEEALSAELMSWVRRAYEDERLHLGKATKSTKRSSAPRGGRTRPAARPLPRLLGEEALDEVPCPVVWVGSREVRGAWASVVLGVGTDGLKRVLGLRSGSVREASTAGELLEDVTARGLRVDDGLLVITEGSRTLDRALERTWGERVLVAHCRPLVRREVLAHIPEEGRPGWRAELEAAWSMPVESASPLLRELQERLEQAAPGAAERLARSREASLVVARLGVGSPLKERLESAGTLRMAFNKSLRWGGSREAGLWALAAGLPVWLRRTRRLIGWRGLEFVAQALRARTAVAKPTADAPENSAAPSS